MYVTEVSQTRSWVKGWKDVWDFNSLKFYISKNFILFKTDTQKENHTNVHHNQIAKICSKKEILRAVIEIHYIDMNKHKNDCTHQMQSKSEGNGTASSQCSSKSGDSSFHVWCSIASGTSLSLIDSPVSVQCFHHGERRLLKLQPSNLHSSQQKRKRGKEWHIPFL